MKRYIISIDQSTTATKAMLFDENAILIERVDKTHKQILPNPGWVEHDCNEIYDNLISTIKTLVKITNISYDDVSSIAISNQRETVVVWDKETGIPIYNAIVWQCARADKICKDKTIIKMRDSIRQKTGLELSPYFSAPKVKWILDNVEGARDKANDGVLLMGTMDSFLVWKLSKGHSHITDYSNASRTMLLNIHTLDWDDELLELFSIPKSMMANVICSDEIVGYTDIEGNSNEKLAIAGIIGDSHGAMFAQNCFEKGMIKGTYGTGSSVMMNIGENPLISNNGLVTSIAWGMKTSVEYVLEGNINYAAATVKWLVDGLGILDDVAQSETLAMGIDSNEGVYIVPAFTGLGAPYWDSCARALICGMNIGTNKMHFARAALESISYQVKDIIECMIKDTNIRFKELRVDGGPTKNSFLMQFQSDILDCDVITNNIEELSAMGSALMAGLAVGIWKDKDELLKLRNRGEVYKPTMSKLKRNKNYAGWKTAIARAKMEEKCQ